MEDQAVAFKKEWLDSCSRAYRIYIMRLGFMLIGPSLPARPLAVVPESRNRMETAKAGQ